MKTNFLHCVANLFESLGIAIALILVGAIATAKAQDGMPQAGGSITIEAQNLTLDMPEIPINGLFTPTAAQRFYQAGREDFDREVDFLADPERYLNGDILQMDEELIRQIEEDKFVPERQPDNFYQLDIDAK